jgi:hypothetical protein
MFSCTAHSIQLAYKLKRANAKAFTYSLIFITDYKVGEKFWPPNRNLVEPNAAPTSRMNYQCQVHALNRIVNVDREAIFFLSKTGLYAYTCEDLISSDSAGKCLLSK